MSDLRYAEKTKTKMLTGRVVALISKTDAKRILRKQNRCQKEN